MTLKIKMLTILLMGLYVVIGKPRALNLVKHCSLVEYVVYINFIKQSVLHRVV